MVRATTPSLPTQLPERWVGLAIVVIISLVAAWATNVLTERARSELVDAKRATAVTMVRVFAASLVAPLDFGDDEGIRARVGDLSSNDQIAYAGVWRENEAAAVAELGQTKLTVPDQVPLVKVFADRLEIVEAVTDPTARRVGTALVAFTLSPERTRYQSARNRIIIVVTSLALAVSAGLLFLARWQLARRPPALPGPQPKAVAASTELGQAFDRLTELTDHQPRPGQLLGPYQLLACVGEGGMGRVWAARHVGSALQRLVAIKTAIHGSGEGAEQRNLFTDEARIALLLRHPNVCGVNEFGEHEGILYQVMEWCDGASLRQVLDGLPQARLPLPVAMRLVASVSAGLHAAHELQDDDGRPLGVVHRDVSPHNILIATGGQVKVTDFGVAKAHGQLHRPTATGEVKGKLSYMAPEQVMGQEVDRRADVFALGCILYEATTGRSPFGGEGALSTMYQLLSQPVPSPKTWVADYPDEVAEIVLTALRKEPAERYQSAEQLAIALESWLAAHSVVVTDATIAEVVSTSVGRYVREKSKRVEQALALCTPTVALDVKARHLPAPAALEREVSKTSAPPTVPAGPGRSRA